MFPKREQDKPPETDPHEMKLCNLPDKEFKIAVIKKKKTIIK